MFDKDRDYQLEYDLEHKDELVSLYHRVDQEVEKSKGRRIALIWIGHILALVILSVALLRISDIQQMLTCVVACLILGSFLFWIEFEVFGWLITHNREDHERRERIIERIKKVKAMER